jgi:hypothetical protein
MMASGMGKRFCRLTMRTMHSRRWPKWKIYGYFWWRPWHNVEMPNGPERVYIGAAQGNGGQEIFVLPEYDFVAAFTAGSYNAGGSAPNRIMNTVVRPRLLAAHGGKSPATK